MQKNKTIINRKLITDITSGDIPLTNPVDYDSACRIASNINKDYPKSAWLKKVARERKQMFEVWVTNSYYRMCELYVIEHCNLKG